MEARHILFQVTPTLSLELLRETGEAVLTELLSNPKRFDELAKAYSNCPSGEMGGNLGQLSRGQTVQEFEDFVFRLKPGELAERLLETRFGLHIVQVLRRVEGQLLPFDTVKKQIAQLREVRQWSQRVHDCKLQGREMMRLPLLRCE